MIRPTLLAVLLVSCGTATAPPAAPTPPATPVPAAPAVAFHLSGRVTFEARQATSTGVSTVTEERPARRVRVVAHAAGTDAVLATTTTTEDGSYVLDGEGDVASIDVVAVADLSGTPLTVASDEPGLRPHAQTFQLPPPSARDGWDGHLEPGVEDTMGGALHILDTLQRGIEVVEGWAGERLPELYVYWGPDITVDWSYYRGERGARRFCLELLAGRRAERTTTDTDEHDEAIILHELGHFVFDRWSTYTSIGGRHPRGSLVDPGVAWEEGRATWLATAIRRDPAYIDSRGVEGSGSARVDESVETPQPPRGPGSETSVAGILWDLSDGSDVDGPVIPDTDADGARLGPAAILRAMRSVATTPGAYPSMGSFLRHLVETGLVPEDTLRSMLRATGEPEAVLDAPWPIDLPLGTSLAGRIDGLTQPAPSGGENRPENGFDAVHAYRVIVPSPGTLTVTLTVTGTGADADHTNLTLEMRNDRAIPLVTSGRPAGPETLTVPLAAGTYVLYVRDAGGGNRADYTLLAALTPD